MTAAKSSISNNTFYKAAIGDKTLTRDERIEALATALHEPQRAEEFGRFREYLESRVMDAAKNVISSTDTNDSLAKLIEFYATTHDAMVDFQEMLGSSASAEQKEKLVSSALGFIDTERTKVKELSAQFNKVARSANAMLAANAALIDIYDLVGSASNGGAALVMIGNLTDVERENRQLQQMRSVIIAYKDSYGRKIDDVKECSKSAIDILSNSVPGRQRPSARPSQGPQA
jgi:hypothetical protein